MAKKYLKISDLIKLVESNKNIYFETSAERKRLKKMIEQYSYLNVFSLNTYFQMELWNLLYKMVAFSIYIPIFLFNKI